MYLYCIKKQDGSAHWGSHPESSGAEARMSVLVEHYRGTSNPVTEGKVFKVGRVIVDYKPEVDDE